MLSKNSFTEEIIDIVIKEISKDETKKKLNTYLIDINLKLKNIEQENNVVGFLTIF